MQIIINRNDNWLPIGNVCFNINTACFMLVTNNES